MNSTQDKVISRSLTMLNEMGDVTLVWSEEEDNQMSAIIEKKMAEGVTFFIVEKRGFGLLPPKKTKLHYPDEAMKHRALAIPDEDFAKFVESGAGEAVPTPAEPVRGARRSKDAKEVAKSQSVGVRQRAGG
jgi:hypothetical protein